VIRVLGLIAGLESPSCGGVFVEGVDLTLLRGWRLEKEP